ncbi:MAG: ATP synthase subunit C [Gemmatimonadota bacterium]
MKRISTVMTLLAITALLALGLSLVAFVPTAAAQGARAGLPPDAWSWGLMAAAVATGLSSLAGGLAVARLGAAAVGALAEKPELFGRLLILVGLAEGIAIYGVIISILILNRLT